MQLCRSGDEAAESGCCLEGAQRVERNPGCKKRGKVMWQSARSTLVAVLAGTLAACSLPSTEMRSPARVLYVYRYQQVWLTPDEREAAQCWNGGARPGTPRRCCACRRDRAKNNEPHASRRSRCRLSRSPRTTRCTCSTISFRNCYRLSSLLDPTTARRVQALEKRAHRARDSHASCPTIGSAAPRSAWMFERTSRMSTIVAVC